MLRGYVTQIIHYLYIDRRSPGARRGNHGARAGAGAGPVESQLKYLVLIT